jgi:hypothetical protein
MSNFIEYNSSGVYVSATTPVADAGLVIDNNFKRLVDLIPGESSEAANTVLAAPNGSSGTPTFRALVAADVPTLNQNTTGSSSSLSANLPTSKLNGGTNASGSTFWRGDGAWTSTPQQFRITFDGGGSAITTGGKVWSVCQFAGTITGYTLLADQSGSIVISVAKASYSGFPTTSSIVGAGTPPTLSSAQKAQDNTLSAWSLGVNAGDVLEYSVTSAATVQHVQLFINVAGV